MIGVHCTHGFNRTGFLICAYLIDRFDFSPEAAVAEFARVRPPGIYKQDYLRELFRRYGNVEETPDAPERPQWDNIIEEDSLGGGDDDDDNLHDEDGSSPKDNVSNGTIRKRKRPEVFKENAEFAMPLTDVEQVTNLEEVSQIQTMVQNLCKWEKAGFPGSQPVSMDCNNIQYLYQKKYMVSWKADGTRYLMFVYQGKVYMLDRDNTVFQVHNLRFPKYDDLNNSLENTLMDGEFVVDQDKEKKIPRFLIYDLITYEGKDIGILPFGQRLSMIEHKIINSRNEAIRTGKIDRSGEPFGVRQKPFYPLIKTKSLLSEEFTKQITHGIDGLIFQPAGEDDFYVSGKCDFTLKWKPPTMNSVDFKLVIRTCNVNQHHSGQLEEEIGELYVGGYNARFSTIKVTKTLRKLNGKIIECKWANNKWEFMRERTDKSYPNALKTAVAVCESIRNPVDEAKLLNVVDYVNKHGLRVDRQLMPPPLPPGSSFR